MANGYVNIIPIFPQALLIKPKSIAITAITNSMWINPVKE